MDIILAFHLVSQQLSIPDDLLSSVCYVESTHNIKAYHAHDGKGNSVGICQIKLSTARMLGFRGTERQLRNPETNIFYAGKYLQHNLIRYNDISKAVIAYNQGHAGNLTSTIYSKKVLAHWKTQLKEKLQTRELKETAVNQIYRCYLPYGSLESERFLVTER